MASIEFGIIQMTSGPVPEHNLAFIEQQVKALAEKGVKWILTPENAVVFGNKYDYHQFAEYFADGAMQFSLANIAKQYRVNLILGSFPVRRSDTEVTTTTLVFDENGHCDYQYDKLHMFDVDVADDHKRYRESETFTAGNSISLIPTDFGAIGLSICYDLRFPHLYTTLRAHGANVIVVPAAFTAMTGKAHWEVLLRARAIENQCWIVAANQTGTHPCGRETWGHSMIISPWGEVHASLDTKPGHLAAQLNFNVVDELRHNMPVAKHIRFEQNLR
ncbi:carbon-nitrogen hydrolase family protein [Vibrio hippocampi]|uniref:Deaminated glutathione amidase n=1 Tax=Vibrio hippocampi TaxID=654686 RepID=A0ABN8DMQ3_9VIBR|nr:carbon-nitrogen hydrolase family protein [Vibrio hippocampi]CAH0526857.1 Deaminated glutathione amidase [Vibrio hippocampi]